MTSTDEQAFNQILTDTAAIKNKQLSNGAREMYFAILSRFSFDQVKAAFLVALESLTFFPEPSEIVAIIEGSAEDRAQQAWATFLDAAGNVGMASAKFYDPAMAAAMTATFGGWIAAGEQLAAGWVDERNREHGCSPEMLAHYANNFRKSYAAFRRHPREVETYVKGRSELSMRGGAFGQLMPRPFHQPVLLIGLLRVVEARLPFDLSTGALLPEARAAIEAGPERAIEYARLVARSLKELPAAPTSPEMATPNQMKALRAAIAQIGDAPQTEEEAEIRQAVIADVVEQARQEGASNGSN